MVSGGREYGLDAMAVREVMKRGEIRRVPHSAGYVAGITNFRGRVISVVDLERLLGRECSSEHAHLVVVETGGEPIGLLVDSVGGMVGAGEQGAKRRSGGAAANPLPVGASITDKRRIALLDVENMFRSVKGKNPAV